MDNTEINKREQISVLKQSLSPYRCRGIIFATQIEMKYKSTGWVLGKHSHQIKSQISSITEASIVNTNYMASL